MLEGQFSKGIEFDARDVSYHIICFCFFCWVRKEDMLLIGESG